MELKELQNEILEFRNKRNWKQFHTIKDLLLGLNIEVAELQELFLWKNPREIGKVKKTRIEEEVSDIFILLTYICSHYDVDLISATRSKLKLNSEKYPIDKSYNSNKKYTEYSK